MKIEDIKKEFGNDAVKIKRYGNIIIVKRDILAETFDKLFNYEK